jgi:hypothetical protein
LFLVERGDDLDENAVFEEAADDLAAYEVDLPFAVLDSSFPVSFVKGSVGPEHLTVAFALVIDEVTFVEITAGEIEFSVPFLESLEVAA